MNKRSSTTSWSDGESGNCNVAGPQEARIIQALAREQGTHGGPKELTCPRVFSAARQPAMSLCTESAMRAVRIAANPCSRHNSSRVS